MVINSLLDTDVYLITQGQLAYFFFPDMQVKYKFILREDIKFPDGFDRRLEEEINHLATLRLGAYESIWLKKSLLIYTEYWNWFCGYHFDPNEVKIKFENNKLDLTIEGLWMKTIYWEVPLLAIISELFFEMTGQFINNNEIIDTTRDKCEQLVGIPFAEFGTRRRFSFHTQQQVITTIYDSISKGSCIGTSNLYFAKNHDIPMIGTFGHVGPMVLQAYGVYASDNEWLKYWKMLYGKVCNTALSDTLTTDHFLNSVDPIYFHLLDGIRQDSGDPIEIGWKIINKWESLGIDPSIKTIVFSDNLNPEKVIKIWDTFKNVTKPVFGIGTCLTNGFRVKPLNMVIKLVEAHGVPVVKLSDDPMKNTGDPEQIEKVKKELGL